MFCPGTTIVDPAMALPDFFLFSKPPDFPTPVFSKAFEYKSEVASNVILLFKEEVFLSVVPIYVYLINII
jgi:hypothetical protein